MTDELKKAERFFCSLQRPPGSSDIHPVMDGKTPQSSWMSPSPAYAVLPQRDQSRSSLLFKYGGLNTNHQLRYLNQLKMPF